MKTVEQYPDGQLDASDEGSLKTALGRKDGRVIIKYGKPVNWVAFDPEGAIYFAESILRQARACISERTTQ